MTTAAQSISTLGAPPTPATSQHAHGPTPPADANKTTARRYESAWQPTERVRRYQWIKALVGCFMIGIFSVWLVVQWSNPAMRWASLALMALTAWVVFASIRDDLARSRGRRVCLADGHLFIRVGPQHTQLPLNRVSHSRWRQDDQPGLWFYNDRGDPIAHMDNDFLADQDEARAFLRWLRRRADVPFTVHWPPTA